MSVPDMTSSDPVSGNSVWAPDEGLADGIGIFICGDGPGVGDAVGICIPGISFMGLGEGEAFGVGDGFAFGGAGIFMPGMS